jgi:hypothetical protein
MVHAGSGDFDTSAIPVQGNRRMHPATDRISQHSVNSHTLESYSSAGSEIEPHAAARDPLREYPAANIQLAHDESSLNVSIQIYSQNRNGVCLLNLLKAWNSAQPIVGCITSDRLRSDTYCSLECSHTTPNRIELIAATRDILNCLKGIAKCMQDLPSNSSKICGNGCMNVRGSGPIAKSANSAARVLHRSMHSVGRWLTMLAGFRFGSHAYDDEDELLELVEHRDTQALRSVHSRHASQDSTCKPSHERKLSDAATAACFACVRPACVEEEMPEAGPVAEGRFTRGDERNRARGGAAKQQGQAHALEVFGTPLVGFGSKNSDMMGGLVGVEMLSYEPSQAVELNPFVDDQEMGAPRSTLPNGAFASEPMETVGGTFTGGTFTVLGGAGLGGAMPLAVTANDPLAPTIDVSDDRLCHPSPKPEKMGAVGAAVITPSASRSAVQAVTAVFTRSTSKKESSSSPESATHQPELLTTKAGASSSEGTTPKKRSLRSPLKGKGKQGATHAEKGAVRPVSGARAETFEPAVETVVVPDEDAPKPVDVAAAHEGVEQQNTPVVISIDNPLRSETPDRSVALHRTFLGVCHVPGIHSLHEILLS